MLLSCSTEKGIILKERHAVILREMFNALVLKLHAWCKTGSMRVRVSWSLLALIALSLISMPVTQRLWAWDGFLHGGQDFETGVFLILVTLCLVLVLTRSGKGSIHRLLDAARIVARLAAASVGHEVSPPASSALLPIGTPATGYSLPLQI